MSLLALALSVAIPEGAALTDAIRARDAEFFQVFFADCAPERVRTMLTDDFEMYHDRAGVVATSADPFVADYAVQCARRQQPDQWRSRRELVADSLLVNPVPGFGAIEQGDHLFFERRGDGPERLAGRAHFVQLWQLTDDGWKLARVFSYAHVAAE